MCAYAMALLQLWLTFSYFIPLSFGFTDMPRPEKEVVSQTIERRSATRNVPSNQATHDHGSLPQVTFKQKHRLS